MIPSESKKVLLFSYGSNMFEKRLKERVPSATFYSVGYLCGYRLTWDKISKDGSGKCDAEYTGNLDDIVWGVLYEIDCGEERNLDKAEGLGSGYNKKNVDVTSSTDGEDSDPVKASMYYATEKDSALRPYNWYKAFVVCGAIEHRLPSSYVEDLEGVESIPDPDHERAEKNE